jgi:hypothetical protein
MAKLRAAPRNDTPLCPECGSDLTFVASWTFRGLWGYDEVHTWECSTHGPLFMSADDSIRREVGRTRGQSGHDGDRESLIPARSRPRPTLKSGAIALAEPDPAGPHSRSHVAGAAAATCRTPVISKNRLPDSVH